MPYGNSRNNQIHESETQRLFEQNNDRMVDELGSKVDLLHQLTIDINLETSSQLKLLNDLDDEFDKTGSALSGTMRKLNKMIQTGGGSQVCYLALFVFLLFLFMYLFLRK
jgi:hypothetical protein